MSIELLVDWVHLKGDIADGRYGAISSRVLPLAARGLNNADSVVGRKQPRCMDVAHELGMLLKLLLTTRALATACAHNLPYYWRYVSETAKSLLEYEAV